MKNAHYVLLMLCLSWGGQVFASTPLDLKHNATSTARITVSNIKGSVTITAWDRNEIHVGGQLGDGAEPLIITGSDSDLSIKVQAKGKSGWLSWGSDNVMANTDLTINVPRSASLKINVISASLNADGIEGGNIDAESVSGHIHVKAKTPLLKLVSVSGGITFSGQAKQAKLKTVSGEIRASTLENTADIQTVSGQMQASGGPWQQLHVSSVSGNAQLTGTLGPNGDINIDTMSGNVQLQLPATLSSNLHASTFSGSLHSDFGNPTKPEHGPGSSLDTVVGKGDGKINVEAFSGDVRITK